MGTSITTKGSLKSPHCPSNSAFLQGNSTQNHTDSNHIPVLPPQVVLLPLLRAPQARILLAWATASLAALIFSSGSSIALTPHPPVASDRRCHRGAPRLGWPQSLMAKLWRLGVVEAGSGLRNCGRSFLWPPSALHLHGSLSPLLFPFPCTSEVLLHVFGPALMLGLQARICPWVGRSQAAFSQRRPLGSLATT